MTANWMGILPGYGTVGRFEPAEEVIHHAEEKAREDGEEADLSKLNLQIFDRDGSLAVLSFGSVDDVITAEDLENGDDKDRQTNLSPVFTLLGLGLGIAIALVGMFRMIMAVLSSDPGASDKGEG